MKIIKTGDESIMVPDDEPEPEPEETEGDDD